MPDVELSFTRAEYANRLAKTRQAMNAAGIELLFTCDPSNMAADWGREITETLRIRESSVAEPLADVPRKLFVKD